MEPAQGGLFSEGEAEECGFSLLVGQLLLGRFPDLGFDPAVAALQPLALDEVIDEGALGGGDRPIFGGELLFQLDQL
jgi:hypothetical protein